MQFALCLHWVSTLRLCYVVLCGCTQYVTCFLWLLFRGYFAVVKSLLKAGARTDLCNIQGESALHLSAASGKHDLCRMLVTDYGADIFAKDHEGKLLESFWLHFLLLIAALFHRSQRSRPLIRQWSQVTKSWPTC
ncbi:ankyrin repeat domain-containing protein [archaeon]|nr:MAG: ankyrin repeat domain-containing protein [archaeon]